MDNFSLECFIAVAECGSFTKAALRVKRTQSAISQQICNLEKKMGVIFFNRTKKNVTLTKDGELFLSYAYQIYDLQQELLTRIKKQDVDGEVRIGVPEDFATLFLDDILKDFIHIHPRVFLSVECDLTMNLIKRFKEGMLDLAIVKLNSAEDFSHGFKIWKQPLVWVCKHAQLKTIERGEPLPLVLSPEPCVYRSRAIAALKEANIPWRMVYTSPSYAGTVAAVKANMGITVLPFTMIPDQLERILEPVLPVLPDIHVSLLKADKKPSSAIETLSQFMLKKFAQGKSSFISSN